MHSRIDACHLSLDRSRWLLCVRHYDDNRDGWPPDSGVDAYAPRARLGWRDAAMLLRAVWDTP